ncbi:MAG: DUF6691 family protein [Burkholderiales bacterium]
MIAAFLCGLLFGAGLLVSQMSNPAKVFGFLDLTGAWDPSLAFVMGGAVGVFAIFYRLVLRRSAPALASGFAHPDRRDVDLPLMLGAAIFGAGWGLGGFCPGPAVVSAAFGDLRVWAFVLAMIVGMATVHVARRTPPGT